MPRDQKLRMTRQREIILSELKKVKSHPSAEEVHEMVRKRLPRISLATVYRNLEILSRYGLIKKLETTGDKKRFDPDTNNHLHIRCVHCDRMDDLPVKPMVNLEEMSLKVNEYELLGYSMEFLGVCPGCKKTSGNIIKPGKRVSSK